MKLQSRKIGKCVCKLKSGYNVEARMSVRVGILTELNSDAHRNDRGARKYKNIVKKWNMLALL